MALASFGRRGGDYGYGTPTTMTKPMEGELARGANPEEADASPPTPGVAAEWWRRFRKGPRISPARLSLDSMPFPGPGLPDPAYALAVEREYAKMRGEGMDAPKNEPAGMPAAKVEGDEMTGVPGADHITGPPGEAELADAVTWELRESGRIVDIPFLVSCVASPDLVVIRNFPALSGEPQLWSDEGPPLYPTSGAVTKWGHQWWRLGEYGGEMEPMVVTITGMQMVSWGKVRFEVPGEEDDRQGEDDGLWMGPVLERPIARGEG